MDKIKEILAKLFAPIILQIGKLNFKKEKLIGVVLKEKELQICEIAHVKGKWKVLNFSNQEIAGIGQDQDIYSAATYLSDQIKNAMSSIKTKTKNVAISLDPILGQIYNLQIPLMEEDSLKQNVEYGGFWEQFDETPETLEDYETSYQVMSKNKELEVMDIALVTIETKVVEAYSNIFRLAGYNPTIIDLAPFAHINTQASSIGKESFEIPVAVLNYTPTSSFITISSNKSFQHMELNIIDADKVLLDTVEDIESVENEFWDEIFERVGGQIKQSLIEFETKNESSPISVLNIITDKAKIDNFSIGLERQLGEMIIKRFNPKDTFDFSDEAEKYLDSLKNHSLISESLGIALRKVNPFEINSHEMFSLNLLPRSNQLKINRKSLVLGKTCLAFASFFVFITLAHLLPFKIPQILANTNRINEIKTFNEDIESKTNILNGYGAKVSQLQSKTENIIGLGSNILTTATVYQELNEKTPENVRFVSLKVSDKDQITIAGVAKDDQSVVEMMNNLTTLNSVTETKIETLIGLSEEDRIALYTTEGEAAPKLEDLPQETISKKFTISLKLNSVEGEKFDDKKIYAELVKRTKKK